ncbi:MAG TPA: chaplin family protein [Actinocrinis sp.]|nr:chaplin family protein [Actinocrinis sp.]
MHGFAKRGLALAAAASGLVIGVGGAAYADATVSGDASNSHGTVSGTVVGAAGEVPVLLCGTGVNGGSFTNEFMGTDCTAAHTAEVAGYATHNGGTVSGNVANVALGVPAEVCGTNADVAGTEELADSTTCSFGTAGPLASAVGTSEYSGGTISGNVVNLGATVPVELCGTNVGISAVHDHLHGTTCSIS